MRQRIDTLNFIILAVVWRSRQGSGLDGLWDGGLACRGVGVRGNIRIEVANHVAHVAVDAVVRVAFDNILPVINVG